MWWLQAIYLHTMWKNVLYFVSFFSEQIDSNRKEGRKSRSVVMWLYGLLINSSGMLHTLIDRRFNDQCWVQLKSIRRVQGTRNESSAERNPKKIHVNSRRIKRKVQQRRKKFFHFILFSAHQQLWCSGLLLPLQCETMWISCEFDNVEPKFSHRDFAFFSSFCMPASTHSSSIIFCHVKTSQLCHNL